jgi:hypothetical protein
MVTKEGRKDMMMRSLVERWKIPRAIYGCDSGSSRRTNLANCYCCA